MSKEFENRVAALRARHEEFLARPNVKKEWGNNGYCLMSKEEFLINTILVGIVGKN